MHRYFKLILLLPLLTLAACSTNQATGRSQFTGLMPASQEAQIGAQEHSKILKQFGGEVADKSIRDYVNRIGQSLVPHTERKDVKYTFTVLDSPVVNAFALPGGYVYVTRGILTLATNEAELAAVIAHEIGHVTARHSAERYSSSVVVGIGASLLSAAIKVDGASEALGLGANLYLSSYSRSQEHESDDLGIRYLSRAGYDPNGMAGFLKQLEASAALEAKETGQKSNVPNYFSTHPVTAERVRRSLAKAAEYPTEPARQKRPQFLAAINGMTVGDSAEQGFIANGKFVHPELGFMFEVPDGYKTENSAAAFVAQSKSRNGGTLLFDSASKPKGQDIQDYLVKNILNGDTSGARDLGTNTINGFKTASVEKSGTVNGVKSNIRFIAFEWDADTVYQMMLATPVGLPATEAKKMQDAAFSFKRMSQRDKSRYKPKRMQIRVAKAGDTIAKLAAKMPYKDNLNTERFRVINGLAPNEGLKAGQAYKVIVQ